MTAPPPGSLPRLVESLARVSQRDRVGRKLLLAPNMAAGRELLRRLTLARGGWIGFEVTTPSRLAHRLAEAGLERSRSTVLDAFDHQALLDEALDSALAAEKAGLGELSEGVGFREKVHGAVNALRMAGIGPKDLDGARFAQWQKKLFLLRVLQRYERLLVERRRADPATVLRLALAALDEAGNSLPATLDADSVHLVPGLNTRGLAGRLIAELGARGAKVLETDAVMGLAVPEALLWGRAGDASPGSYLHAVDDLAGGDQVAGPESTVPRSTPAVAPPAEAAPDGRTTDPDVLDIDFFHAASVDAELREVLRRVVEQGLRWDQVEIVTPDPAAYGSGLHALATRLGIPVTYAVGLPVARTRTGRVVQAYLDWIEEGFQADPIRRLLEAGDLRPPKSRGRHAPAALARRFRSLRIGWGRKRYRAQIREALAGVDEMQQHSRESESRFESRRARARDELEALKSILFPALKATPSVPDRMGVGGEPVSPSELARGLQAFLRRVPRGRGPDRHARDEIGRILERIEATLKRRTDFRSCVSIVRRHLDIRVRPELHGEGPDGSGAPWSSTGGSLHMSDLEHGGYTGREAVFLVGLDADLVPGTGGQDPVLLDSDRRVLGADLPTSAEVLRERIFRFAALVSRLRGRVTMSYRSWQPTEARTVGPSSVLLQALRLTERDSELTFSDLHARMGRVVSAIPPGGRPPLDGDDVWMAALGSGAVLRLGLDAVRAVFPPLDRGLDVVAARRDGTPGAVHGVIAPRDSFDPRRDPDIVLSPSRLQALGTCPLRYLHSSVLRAYPPDDPELDPDRWLDPRARGELLHSVYDTTLRTAKARGVKPTEKAFEVIALDALRQGIERLRHEVPSPGEGTLDREIATLREDVRSFVRMVLEDGPEDARLEYTFGIGDDEPVTLPVDGGSVKLRGAIDRVDSDLKGLHVIDYKTGVAYGHGKDVFDGGRRLQHALYAHAAEARLDNRVVDGQYHFPTRRGQNQRFVYKREDLEPVGELVSLMLDGVAKGHFVPTDDSDDCKFCDYAEVCRARQTTWGVESPLADWSKEQLNLGLQPAFAHLKKVRTFEE